MQLAADYQVVGHSVSNRVCLAEAPGCDSMGHEGKAGGNKVEALTATTTRADLCEH